jgi:hypothetical protein
MSIRWSLHLNVCQSVVCSSSACLHVHFYAYPLVISFSSLSIHKPACPSVKLLSVMLICWSHYLLICPFTVCLSACLLSFHLSSSLYVHFYVHLLVSSSASPSIHPLVCLVNLSICMFVCHSHLSVELLSLHSSACLYNHFYVHSLVYSFVSLAIHLCAHLLLCLSFVCLFIHSYVRLLVCLSK